MSSLAFEKDLNWMEKSKMRKNQFTPIVVFAIIIALVATVIVVTGTQASSTAPDRPDWQEKNTIQNMFENYVAWSEYTTGLDKELEEDNAPHTDLLGEAYSVSQEFIQHIIEQGWPSGSCAQDFYILLTDDVGYWSDVYIALYYNLTTLTGEPVDVDFLVQQGELFSEYYWTQDGISDKCWNKLDV